MKKNKGFTLIELLAIIIILAIIAVITVPIILNVIDNAKRGTAKDSAYGYKDAISKYYVSGMLEDESVKLSGDYNVVDGKLGEYDIPFSGTKPTSGYLRFENNAINSGCLTIDEYKVTFDKGEVTDVEVGECGQKVYKCKRADLNTLHTEECTQTSTTHYCGVAGYTTGNKGTTITYGNKTITNGTLTSGDAYDCDVNGDGMYDSQTERFYYVSELYNTQKKEFDSNYAVLIYFNNTTNGQTDNTISNLLRYDNVNQNNANGPVTAKNNLPTINDWSNIRLSNTSRTILNSNNENTVSWGTPLIANFVYEKEVEGNNVPLAARLLTYQEAVKACGDGTTVASGYLNSCEYLMENTKYSNSSFGVHSYWLETPCTGYEFVIAVNSSTSSLYTNTIDANRSTNGLGVRPAIEVLKTDIEI